MLLVDKDVTVTSLALVHVDDGLVGVGERACHNPRLDVLVNGELEHLSNLARRANQAATNLHAVKNESESVDDGQVTTIGSTNMLETITTVKVSGTL